MSGALALVGDAFDWTIDTLRAVVGLPPLPPSIVTLAFDHPPAVRIPVGLRVETRRTIHAFLRLQQDQLILFEGPPPREGRVSVTPLTGALIQVHLTLELRHPMARHGCVVAETIVEPLPNGPAVERFEVAKKALLGDSLACAWHAPAAQRVRLAAIAGDDITDHIGPPSGQLMLRPGRPGRLMLRLTAENDWGQTTLIRAVDVAAPKLRIRLPRPAVQAGHPGEELRFEWKAEGAESVWLIAPGGVAPRRVIADGLLFARLGWQPAEFQLIARGYGGAEKSVTFRAVPQPFACLETA